MSEPSTPFNEVQSVIDSLRRDLDVERKRTERLDNLLLTNANLRKKLQQELHDSRQRCDMLTVEVEGLKGTTEADTAKSVAEANSYKQLYFKSLEEIAQSRNQCLEQASLVATLSDERDAMQMRLTEVVEQLGQYSPARLRRPRLHGENIAEVEEENALKARYAALADVDANNWLTGGPAERDEDSDENDDDDDISMAQLDPHELQRIVVGLYRRLKACETVLRETNDARLELSSKHIDQQREIEHMQRKIAIRSPLVIRREAAAGSYCPTCAARKNERTASAPRRGPQTTTQGGAPRPTSATRPVSSSSRPVSGTRTVSAPKRTVGGGGLHSATASKPVSQATSARSHSGYSNVSLGGVRGPALTHVALPGRDVTRRKSPYQIKEEQRVQSNRSRSPLLRSAGPAPAANAPPSRRPSSDEGKPAAGGVGTHVSAPVLLIPRSAGVFEDPPIISRRT